MTNARRPRVWLWALVIAHVLGDLAVACHDRPGVFIWDDFCDVSIWCWVAGGLVSSQIGLLAWLAVGSTGQPALKCGGCALGMLWLNMLPIGQFTWQVLLTGPGVLAAMAIVFAALRFRGVRLVASTQCVGRSLSGAGRKWIQFSLGELLMFLTGLALALSLVATQQPYPRYIVDLPVTWWEGTFSYGFMMDFAHRALETTALTLLAAWALCGKQQPAVTFAAVPFLLLAIAAASIHLVIVSLGPVARFQTDWPHLIHYTGLNVMITFTFSAASFLVVRHCGYRYTRPASKSELSPAK